MHFALPHSGIIKMAGSIKWKALNVNILYTSINLTAIYC